MTGQASEDQHVRDDPPDQLDSRVQTPKDDVELQVVEKVSEFIRNDYPNKYGTLNELEFHKKPLKTFFTALDLKPEYHCSEQCTEDYMYKIFDGWEGSRKPTRILLHGGPGIGKTTLCQKYVYDWANPDIVNTHPFDQFKVVVFLKLYDVRGTLEEILTKQVFGKRLSAEERQQFFSYMMKHPEVFLFILDGVNECNLDLVPEIKDLLEDKSYKGVYLIATSRPALTTSWIQLCNNFHMLFCVKGYSDEKVLEFIANYFKGDQSKVSTLTEHIRTSSNLMHLGRIPLLTPIICELWQPSKPMPALPALTTMTKLLNSYSIVVARSFCLKNSIDWNCPIEKKKIEDCLDNLGKLALKGVLTNSMQYMQSELKDCGVDSKSSELGFLSARPELYSFLSDEAGFHSFAHKSIQEFLAARWLVKNWTSEAAVQAITKMLQDEEIDRFHSILVFIAGLLSSSNKQNVDPLVQFIQRLATSSSDGSFLENCSYGYRMQLLLESFYEAWKENDTSQKSSPIAQGILSLIHSTELFTRSITPGGFPLHMGFAEVQGLCFIVTSMKSRLSTLNLSGILIQKREAKILAEKCLQGNSSVTSVRFSNCCLCPEAVEVICHALKSMSKLEKVDLSCCNLSSKGLKAVAHLLKYSKGSIKTLQLGDTCHASQVQRGRGASPGQLSEVRSRIKELCVFQEQFKLSPPSVDAIQELICTIEEEACDLEEISLFCCHVGDLIGKWLQAFRTKSSLREIRLHLKHLDTNLSQDLNMLVSNMPLLNRLCVKLEDATLTSMDYMKYIDLLQGDTNGKIKLRLIDYTHSTQSWSNVMTVGLQ